MNIGRIFSTDNVVSGAGAIVGAGIQAANLATVASHHGQSFADPATVVSALTAVISGGILGVGMFSAIRTTRISDPARRADVEAKLISPSTMLLVAGLTLFGDVVFATSCKHEAPVDYGTHVPAGTYHSGTISPTGPM